MRLFTDIYSCVENPFFACGRVTFFACTKKVTKEMHPGRVGLRLPSQSGLSFKAVLIRFCAAHSMLRLKSGLHILVQAFAACRSPRRICTVKVQAAQQTGWGPNSNSQKKTKNNQMHNTLLTHRHPGKGRYPAFSFSF